MDRIAACKVYKGAAYKDSDPLIYYNSGKAGDMMHKDTRKLLEKLLHMLAEQGEETVFCYVRREILKRNERYKNKPLKNGLFNIYQTG